MASVIKFSSNGPISVLTVWSLIRVMDIQNTALESHVKVFMYVFIHVFFVGTCTVLIQSTRENLIHEKHVHISTKEMAVHKYVGLAQHTTHLDKVRSI